MTAMSVSVQPFPDESIASMLRRLGRFLNVPIGTLYRGPTRRITQTPIFEELARVLGVPAPQLMEHDLSWRRHDGLALSASDYRPSGTLTCSGCGIETIWSELVLAPEVAVDRPRRQPGLGDDVGHRGGLEPLAGE